MNLLESEWLGERLSRIPDDLLFPLLNLGSSTFEFSTQFQPQFDQNVLAPLRTRGGTVYHLDIKSAPGVDLVGDLLTPAFLEQVANMQVRSVMVSNVLEHLYVRQPICDIIVKILPRAGYIFVSGPH